MSNARHVLQCYLEQLEEQRLLVLQRLRQLETLVEDQSLPEQAPEQRYWQQARRRSASAEAAEQHRLLAHLSSCIEAARDTLSRAQSEQLEQVERLRDAAQDDELALRQWQRCLGEPT